ALGLGQTFSLHALVGLLRDFSGEIRAANANVDDPKTQRCRIGTQLLGNFTHHRSALFGKSSLEAAQTVDPAQSRIKTGTQALFGKLQATGHGLTEQAGIFDGIGYECINFVELAAGNLNADVIQIEANDTVLDDLD